MCAGGGTDPRFLCARVHDFLTDTSNQNRDGYIYPTIRKDANDAGPQNNNVVPACHMCCYR